MPLSSFCLFCFHLYFFLKRRNENPLNLTPMAESNRSLADCAYFFHSGCYKVFWALECFFEPIFLKGEECGFRHSLEAQQSVETCSKWLGGNCFDVSCPQRHPVFSRPSMPPCKYFAANSCERGDSCLFSHQTSGIDDDRGSSLQKRKVPESLPTNISLKKPKVPPQTSIPVFGLTTKKRGLDLEVERNVNAAGVSFDLRNFLSTTKTDSDHPQQKKKMAKSISIEPERRAHVTQRRDSKSLEPQRKVSFFFILLLTNRALKG